MKKLNILWSVIAICLIGQTTYAQQIGDLNGIYYQAVAIDENGKEIVGMDIEDKPLFEKAIGVRFTITKGLNGAIQWEETHTTTTDKYGLFSLIIGKGTPTGSAVYTRLLDIPWIDADQFLKVEISTKNDGNYVLVSNQQFMTVPYSFYTDDIADNAITTAKVLNETLLAEDIGTGSIETSEILDETILAEDIATGAVTTSEILNETIAAEDIAEGAVTTSEILDETIVAGDIASGAVTTAEILNGTVVNEDIADGTIDLTSKVTGVLPVANGGMGNATLTVDNILVGSGTDPIKAKVLASTDSSLIITQTSDSIILKTQFKAAEVTSDPAGTFNIPNIPAGDTWVSNAINYFGVNFGDIIVGSIDQSLQGCMLTAYVSQQNVIRIAIYNGTGGQVNFGLDVNLRVFVIR
ncbi:MAG: hypothetical protein JXR41_15605 [Bacteroidales bacterium]|nr:hypothetical protein [Bacteroidales bacterium]MBN2764520.1 hypothetical protein [Bacteroidales bacterium]